MLILSHKCTGLDTFSGRAISSTMTRQSNHASFEGFLVHAQHDDELCSNAVLAKLLEFVLVAYIASPSTSVSSYTGESASSIIE